MKPALGLKPRSHRERQRASTHQIKLMSKIVSIHTDRIDARQLISQLTQNIRGTFNFALQNIFSYRTLYECFLNVVNVPGKHK